MFFKGSFNAWYWLSQPYSQENFNAFTIDQDFAAETVNPAYKFAFPPLPWKCASERKVLTAGFDTVMVRR